MNIKSIHVISFEEINYKTYFTVEITEGLENIVTYTTTICSEQMKDYLKHLTSKVSYEDNSDLEIELKYLNVGYIELALNADSSNENDLYIHYLNFYNGKIFYDYEKGFFKTYVRENYAIKKAKELAEINKMEISYT